MESSQRPLDDRSWLRRLDHALYRAFLPPLRWWDIHVRFYFLSHQLNERLALLFPPSYKLRTEEQRRRRFNLQFRYTLYDWVKELEPLPEYPQFHSSGAKFQHTKLPERTALRFLHLEPGLLSSPIICSLSTYPLQHAPPYEALSYTWGCPEPQFHISCNGLRMGVSENLWHALHRLRRIDQARILWIDAICINQDDMEERNHQVTMMKEIYSSASHVIVWLGEASKDTSDAVSLVKSLAANESLAQAYNRGEVLTEVEMDSFGLPAPWYKDWYAFEKLLSRPWFSRVWIIQEIIMSKTATFLVGGEELTWREILQATEYVAKTNVLALMSRALSAEDVSFLNRIGTSYYYGAHGEPPGLPLLYLLDNTRRSVSTLREDKVYGLLGLSCDAESLGIQPDYSISANELYIKITLKFLEAGNVDILNSNGDLSWKFCRKLPTWVPDWPSSRPEIPFDRTLYCSNNSSPEFEVSEDSRTLIIRGLEVDIVSCVGIPYKSIVEQQSGPLNDTKLARLQQGFLAWIGYGGLMNVRSSRRVRVWEKIGFGLKSYPTGEAVSTAYYRTLAANKVPQDATPTYLEQCYQLFYQDNAAEMTRVGFLRPGGYDIDSGKYRELVTYGGEVSRATLGRNIFVTMKGYMGLCPRSTRLNDKVVVFFGGRTPFILRKARKGKHELLGECYMHGLMNGEAGKMGISPQSFAIV